MNPILVEVVIAVVAGFAIAFVVMSIGSYEKTAKSARKRKVPVSKYNFSVQPKTLPRLQATLHPFAWDKRVVVAAIFGIGGLLLHLWVFVILGTLDGWMIGELFTKSDLEDLIDTLNDATLFVSRFANSLGLGNVSTGDVVIRSLDALPVTSKFRTQRMSVYQTLASMQINNDVTAENAETLGQSLIGQLLAEDNMMELRAIDQLVYSSLTNTQWRLGEQLTTLSNDLSRRIRSINESIHSELLPMVTGQRLVVLFSLGVVLIALVGFGSESALAADLATNLIVSLTLGVSLFVEAYLMLRARLRMFSPTLFL